MILLMRKNLADYFYLSRGCGVKYHFEWSSGLTIVLFPVPRAPNNKKLLDINGLHRRLSRLRISIDNSKCIKG
jgi:hypothetical protein